ncbi:hypothetical protein K3740_16710 [Ruegeria conchae]|uniref:hypothetical protein n=1 Tax=Ruegeria conchae TaxID=981384 RepID=UPI00147F6F00|nr:hypothetical protein [Ruegeria conchae]UWR02664.1 hypothetical protein K3740_16710 [Ruegeria conchae]
MANESVTSRLKANVTLGWVLHLAAKRTDGLDWYMLFGSMRVLTPKVKLFDTAVRA